MDVTDAKMDILENVFLKNGTTAIYLYVLEMDGDTDLN